MEDPDTCLAIRALAVVAVFAAVAWPIHETFGAAGINAALIVALGAVEIVLSRVAASATPLRKRTKDDHGRTRDTWRSERWIRDALEEGIEGREEWRRHQDRG